MREVDGKREWLAAWDGENEHGEGLLDSWEPTANVSEVACTEYFETAKALARPAVLDRARYPAVAGAGCTWGVEEGTWPEVGCA